VVRYLVFITLALFLVPAGAVPGDGSDPVMPEDILSTVHRKIDFNATMIPNTEGDGFEPHILAGPGIDGREWLYADAPTGWLGGQSGNLWISKDHGDTWGEYNYGRNAGGSGDSYTAIAKDGTIYYTDLYLWSSTIDTSKDGGETWIRNPLATVTRIGDRQWLNMGPTAGTFPGARSETLYMTYNSIPQGLIIQRAQWTSRGFFWTMGNHRTPVVTEVGSRDAFCVDPTDGTIYLPNKESGEIAVYVSTDGADSFTRYTVLSTEDDAQNIFIAGDVDPDGNVYLTWSTQAHMYLGVSTSKGQDWNIIQVTDTNGTRVMPWVTAGDPGRVALTWYDTTDVNGSSDEKTDANWSVQAAITTDALADNVSFLISPIMDYVHTGAIRTTGTGGDSDRDLGDFFSCDVDQYGRLVTVFGMDGDDGVDARKSWVMFGKQLEGPFLKKDVGPVAVFENTTEGLTVYADGSRSYDMSGERIVEFVWNWGDGTNGTGIRAEHKYERSGDYRITLKVVDAIDMRSSATGTVSVREAGGGVGGALLILLPLGLIAAAAGAYIIWKRSKTGPKVQAVKP
jgi:hypothetical protein